MELSLKNRKMSGLLFITMFCIGAAPGFAQEQKPPKPGSLTSPKPEAQAPSKVGALTPPPSIGEQVIAQEASVQDQLKRAAKAQEAARGRKGPRRLQLLHDAIAYYQAVPHWWPAVGEECAVAAFRRGEIHRALQESGEARGAFEEVLEVSLPADDLHVRAILELGHLDRREHQWSHAILRYRNAVACEKASLRFRNDGREWLVKVHLRTMAWQAAGIAAEQWLAVCESPAEEIQIMDFQIRAKIGRRQLRKADEMLRELRQRMAVISGAPTSEGARVQRALEQMKAPAALDLARQNGR